MVTVQFLNISSVCVRSCSSGSLTITVLNTKKGFTIFGVALCKRLLFY